MPKWLEIDQDTKFSALNVDFSSSNLNPLESGLLHTGIEEGYPRERSLFYCCWLI